MKKIGDALKYISIMLLLLIVGFVTLYVAGVRVNTTKSIPVGFYQIIKKDPQIGDYVIFCPPNTAIFQEAKDRGYINVGNCEGELGYMMKKILAAKKNHVEITADGVVVDGVILPYSKSYTKDKAGRALQPYQMEGRELDNDELLLMSDVNPSSFDARYFGIIDVKQVDGVIKPIFVW